MPSRDLNDINTLAREANLYDIVEALGGRVRRTGDRGITLCPFHEDNDPSLHLYPAGNRAKPHFHCYSCGAHGDAFHLIQKYRSCDFLEAVEWLARHQGKPVPTTRRGQRVASRDLRREGLLRAWKIYGKQTAAEQKRLKQWAKQRGFSLDFLTGRHIVAANTNKLSHFLRSHPSDREALAELEAAELVTRFGSFAKKAASGYLNLADSARDTLFGNRIVFPLRNIEGGLVGFAGRSIATEPAPQIVGGPKYLYSRGFKRAETLYRADAVAQRLRALREQPDAPERHRGRFDLYLCEGLMDALRLESRGCAAVAVLGSRITKEQVDLLGKLAEQIEALNLFFACHLFFDRDDAGRKGMVDALPMILDAMQNLATWRVDVIQPHEDAIGKDPDDMLRNLENGGDAENRLSDSDSRPEVNLLF